MKRTKVLRTLAIALTTAVLLVALPATPVLAASLSVSPSEGEIDEEINVYGSTFSANSTVYIYFSDDDADVGDYIDDQVINYERVRSTSSDNFGAIDTFFTVPDKLTDGDTTVKVHNGTYFIYATYSASDLIRARDTFEVIHASEITLDPENGIVGTEVDIDGVGFGDKEDIRIEYDGDRLTIKSGDKITDSSGEFTCKVVVPASTAGSHTITAIGVDSDAEASATFTVESHITLSPTSVTAGDTVTVSGTGFGNAVNYTVSFDTVEVIIDKKTNSSGSFTATFAALARGAGAHDVEAVDDKDNSDTAQLTLAPAAMTISPTSGYVGDEVSVTGNGFLGSKPLSIIFDNTLMKAITTDAWGRVSSSFVVPTKGAGTYTVKVSDGTSILQANFAIVTSATISTVTSATSPGYVGMGITVNGVGFLSGRTVTVTYDGAQVATAAVNPDRTFSATFQVPASRGGSHTITASDGTNTKQFTFVMDSTPPPAPALIIPQAGTKARSMATFEWTPVTDPSGVTYNLQISTKQDFSVMLVSKTGLTQPTYTLTSDEKLKAVNSNNPYYWRVKAIDGASNESPWYGPSPFTVGFQVTTQVLLYVVIGIGAVILILLAFLLGRRASAKTH